MKAVLEINGTIKINNQLEMTLQRTENQKRIKPSVICREMTKTD